MSPPAFDLHRLLRDVFAPQPGEPVACLVDVPAPGMPDHPAWEDRRRMAAEWHAGFAGLGCRMLPIIEYAATGAGGAPLPRMGRMAGQPVAMAEVVRAARIAVALTEFSATAQLVSWIKESAGQLRAASLPGVLRRMEQTALAADYSVVGRHARHLADKLTRADAAVAWFDTGHTLRIDLRWRAGRADDGDCRGHTPINLINLPSGEAYIAPYEGERPGQPSRTAGEIPVRTGDDLAVFTVAANTIQAVQGDGPLAAHYRGFFAADPARRNIAELGLGCNDRAIVTGNVLEDEKAGFHWAYGRSENWGGVTGPEQFLGPATVVHHDVVYARGSPIGMARVALEYPDGTQEEILRQGNYVNLP